MDRLRVLVLTVWFPTEQQPWAHTFVRAHALAAARRHDVSVLHLRPADREIAIGQHREVTDPAVASGLVVHQIGVRNHGRVPLAATLGRVRRTLSAWPLLGMPEPDVIHAHMIESVLPALQLSRRMRRTPAVIASEHYSGFALGTLTLGQRVKLRLGANRLEAVLPVSESLASSLRAHGLRTACMVVPNAFDPTLFHPAEGRPGSPPVRILAVGRLHSVKGFDVLVAALGQLEGRSDWDVDIVGDGPQRDDLEAAVRAAGLSDRVRFHGATPPPQVAEFLRQAHLLVAPSRFETHGAAVVEAVASGVPVVAADVGGLPEIIGPAQAGRLVPPDDADALAQAIRGFLEGDWTVDPEALVATARDRWSLDAVGDRLDRIYRDVIHGSP